MYHSDWHGWCVYLYTFDICAYIWCTSDSLKWWDLFSRRSYELLALILINSAHSDRHRHAMQVIHGRYDAFVISRSILHPESPWDLVLWFPGATGLHIHMQLWWWPCYFPNTLVRVDVQYVGIAAWNMCTVMVCTCFYFASFMIMLFDCTGNNIRCITLTGMADVYNLYTVDICAYIWCTSDSLKWWDLFSRRSYELLALILINSAHSDRHQHAMQVVHGR